MKVRKNRSQEFFANRTSLTTIITTMSAIHVSLEARKDKKSFLILSDRHTTSLILYLSRDFDDICTQCKRLRQRQIISEKLFPADSWSPLRATCVLASCITMTRHYLFVPYYGAGQNFQRFPTCRWYIIQARHNWHFSLLGHVRIVAQKSATICPIWSSDTPFES